MSGGCVTMNSDRARKQQQVGMSAQPAVSGNCATMDGDRAREAESRDAGAASNERQ
jgi:hypothetical protein